MKCRTSLLFAAALSCVSAHALCGQEALQTMTIEGAVAEAVQNNLALLSERANLSIAEAGLITARLRPNPVLSGSAESLDLLGTGFDEANQRGPPQHPRRCPIERGRQARSPHDLAAQKKQVARPGSPIRC